jgi:hypothetical protein
MFVRHLGFGSLSASALCSRARRWPPAHATEWVRRLDRNQIRSGRGTAA